MKPPDLRGLVAGRQAGPWRIVDVVPKQLHLGEPDQAASFVVEQLSRRGFVPKLRLPALEGVITFLHVS
jgi:hypothetical protein